MPFPSTLLAIISCFLIISPFFFGFIINTLRIDKFIFSDFVIFFSDDPNVFSNFLILSTHVFNSTGVKDDD